MSWNSVKKYTKLNEQMLICFAPLTVNYLVCIPRNCPSEADKVVIGRQEA